MSTTITSETTQTINTDFLPLEGTDYVEFYVVPDLNASKEWIYTDAVGLAFTESVYTAEVIPHAVMNQG